ncbi:hypothetical protein D3C72_1187420 [compost metagenome]
MKSALFLCCILFAGIAAKAQVCDTIYRAVQYPPVYTAGQDALNKFIYRDIVDVVSRCSEEGENPVTKLYIVLTTNHTGSVSDVYFRESELTEKCTNMLCHKLLDCKGWKPEVYNGREVCCQLLIPIKCMKWQ